MAKLIHSSSLANVLKNTTLYSSNAYTDLAKAAVIYTDDGYIVTKGHEYYIPVIGSVSGAAVGTSSASISSDGKLSIIDYWKKNLVSNLQLPVYKLTSGNVITVTNSTGNWTIDHNYRVKVGTESSNATKDTADVSLLGFETSTYAITPNLFSFDKFGHISGISSGTAIDVDKISDQVASDANTSIYLLGSTDAAASSTYYKPSKFANLYATIGTDNKITLHVDNIAASVSSLSGTLGVANGGTGATSLTAGGILYGNGTSAIGSSVGTSGLVLISGGSSAPSWRSITNSVTLSNKAATYNSLVTESAVANAISTSFAANDAMVFKGVATATDSGATVGTLASDSAGYTWRASNAGYLYADGKFYTGTLTGKGDLVGVVEAGDLIICITDGKSGTNATYAVVLANIDGAVTASSSFTANLLVVGGGDNRTLKTLAAGTEGLVLKMIKLADDTIIPTWSTDYPNREVKVGDTTVSAATSTSALTFASGNAAITVSGSTNTVTYSHVSSYTAHSSGLYKITTDAYGHVTAASGWDPSTLTINIVTNSSGVPTTTAGTALKFDPDGTALTIAGDRGISIYNYNNAIRFGHTNSVTALSTAGLYKITYDAYGHLTSDTTSWDPSTITFSNVYTTRTGSTAASDDTTNKYYYSSFDPDGKSVTIKASDGLNLYSDTTNHAIVIGHSSTAASTGITNSGRTYILSLTLDSYGHVTGVSTGTESVTNTWRPIYAWKTSEMANSGDTIDLMVASGTGTRSLAFSSTFGYSEKSVTVGSKSYDVSELDLVWAEVGTDGSLSYAI